MKKIKEILKKFFKKYKFAKISAIIFLLLIFLYFFVTSSWFITTVILPHVSRSLEIQLSAEKCRFSLYSGSLIMEDVYFSDDKEISIRFDKMVIKTSLASLFKKKVHLRHVELENSEINYQQYQDREQRILDARAFQNILTSEEKRYSKITGEKIKVKAPKIRIDREILKTDGEKTVNFFAQYIAEKLKDINIDLLKLKNINVNIKFINQQRNYTKIKLDRVYFELENLALNKRIRLKNNFGFSMFADKVVNIERANVTSVLECFIENDGKIRELNVVSQTDEIVGKVKKVRLEKHFFRLKIAGEGVNDVFNLKEFDIQQFDEKKKLVSSVTSTASTVFRPFLGKFNIKVDKISQELMTIVGVIAGNEIIGDCSPKFDGTILYSQDKIQAMGDLQVKFRKSRPYPFINALVDDDNSFLRILNYHAKNVSKVNAELNYDLIIIPKVDDVEIKKVTINIENNLAEKFSFEVTEDIKFSLPKLLHKIKIERHYLHPFTQGAIKGKIVNFRLDKLTNSLVKKSKFSMDSGHVFSQFNIALTPQKNIDFKVDNFIKNMKFKVGKDIFSTANYKIFSAGNFDGPEKLTLNDFGFIVEEPASRLGIVQLIAKDASINLNELTFDLNKNNILVYDSVLEFLPSRYLKDNVTVDLRKIYLDLTSHIELDLKNNFVKLTDYNLNIYEKGLLEKFVSINGGKLPLKINYDNKNNDDVLNYPLTFNYSLPRVGYDKLTQRFLSKKTTRFTEAIVESDGKVVLRKNDVDLDAEIIFENNNKVALKMWNKSKANYNFNSKILKLNQSEFNLNDTIKFMTLGNLDFKNRRGNLQLDIEQLNESLFVLVGQKKISDEFKFDGEGKGSVIFNIDTYDFKTQSLIKLKNINKKVDLKGKILFDIESENKLSKIILSDCDILLFDKTNNLADLTVTGQYFDDTKKTSFLKVAGENLDLTDIVDKLEIGSKRASKIKNNEKITVDKMRLKDSKPLLDYLPDEEIEPIDLKNVNLRVTADLKNTKYREINGELNCKCLLFNNAILLKNLSFKLLGGGDIYSNGAIDCGAVDGFPFKFNCIVKDLPLTDIMNSILPTVEKYSHGTLNNLAFEAVGKGFSKSNVKRYFKSALKADGRDFFIPNDYAKIRAYRLIFIPLEVLGRLESLIPNLVSFSKVTSGLRNISDVTKNVNGFSFYSGKVGADFEDGRLFIKDFSLEGYLIREVRLLGFLNLYEQEKLDLKALIRLPFLEFPFEIKGYLLKPKTIYRKSLQGVIKNNTIRFFDSLKKSGDAASEGGNYIFDFLKEKL